MKRFLFILLVLLSCFSYKSFCYDETFEEYDTSQGRANLRNYWGINEKNNADGTGIMGVSRDEATGSNALHLNIVSNKEGNAWFDSYVELTNLNASDKFMIKAKIKVTKGSRGVFELYLRTGSGSSGGLYLARSSDGRIEILPGIASPSKAVNVPENEYFDIAVLLDRENDIVAAYSGGVQLARRTGYLKGTNNDRFVFEDSKLRFYATFQGSNRPAGATLDAYVDDIIFQDNISQTDGFFCAPVTYKTVFGENEYNLYYVGGQVGADALKVEANVMNLLTPMPVSLISSVIAGNIIKEIDTDTWSQLPTGEMTKLSIRFNDTGEDITELKSFLFNGIASMTPMILTAEPAEVTSPFPDNALGQEFLADSFAVYETSGLLYYGNDKVIPEYFPFSENQQMYINVSDLSQAFDLEIDTQSYVDKIVADGFEFDKTTEAIEKQGQWYLPLGIFYIRLIGDSSDYHHFRSECGKLTVISREVKQGSSAAVQDAIDYLRFERPDIIEIRSIIKEDLSPRPRILINPQDLDRIKTYYENPQESKRQVVVDAVNSAKSNSNSFMSQAPREYSKPDGLRLLEVSREVLRRLEALSFSYMMTEDETERKKYADRAWLEIENVCNFPDWNANNHFLDPGEMMAAFAVAYDWLHDYLTDEQKALMREKMMEYGIIPTYNVHRKIAKTSNFWRDNVYNWNVVCNGGAVMAALAIVDDMEDKSVCIDVITNAIRSLEYMMPTFDPDGAWPEGPSYWSYTTSYLARMISTLDASLGRDFGLTKVDGLKKTAEFVSYAHGALSSNSVFNFHDAWVENINASQLMWFARKLDDSNIASLRFASFDLYSGIQPVMFDALWYDERFDGSLTAIPLSQVFKGPLEMASHRSNWDETNGMFLATQAGNVDLAHAHWDNGSFVLDNDGYRWAADIGTDSYNLGIPSNQIYRVRTEAHNTIVINPDTSHGQDTDAINPITRFESNDNAGLSVIDLTSAYKKHVNSAIRAMGLFDNRSKAVVRDEISLKGDDETIYWFMTTPWVSSSSRRTEITHDSEKQQFRIRNGRSSSYRYMYLKYKIEGDASIEANFGSAVGLPESEIPTTPAQASNTAYRRLYIKLTEAKGDVKITVMFTPNESDQIIMDKDIDQWNIDD